MNAAASPNEPELSGDETQFREGLAHLQAGEWQEAIRCLEALSPEGASRTDVRTALQEARFKAKLDSENRVRPKQWVFPWRLVVVRTGIVAGLVLLALLALNLLTRQAAPMWARAQADRQANELLKKGNAYLEAGKFIEAEASFLELLSMRPNDPQGQQALTLLTAAREAAALYEQGVVLQKAGDLLAAQEKFTDVALRKSDYKDASLRITEIRRQLELEAVWERAETDYAVKRCADAVVGYQEVRAMNATYKKDIIAQRLFQCYMSLGREIVQRDPPAPELMPKALDLFTRALSMQPRDTEAAVEHQLANVYLAGQASFDAGRSAETIAALAALYSQRPRYLGGSYLKMLYDAYIRQGDSFRDDGDIALAWSQYHQASQLPVSDTVLAQARKMSVEPMLTPTPTPTVTPSPTLVPTPTPMVLPTPKAAPTPAAPLATYRNQIIFWSDKEDEPGFWVVNPDGGNRRYLGNKSILKKEFDELLKTESISPDGRYRVYTTTEKKDNAPQVYIQGKVNEWGNAPTWQVTIGFEQTSYDPVWSPDGSRIALVSQQRGSDDVWVVNVDASDPRNCTPNGWEWDKHPSWSPDSSRIVFWSNRDGLKQIYVMDANCKNIRRISNTAWDEYDPLWVK
jgi:TolB protein